MDRLRWDPRWPRFGVGEWITTGLFAATALAFNIVPAHDQHLRGGLLMDEDVRGALVAGDLEDQHLARDISDVLLTLMVGYPFLVDGLVVAAWRRRSFDVAYQMSLINMETMAVVLGLQSLVKYAVARERPYSRTCGELQPEDSRDCDGASRYHSFFSGHTAMTFASAGLICSHHLNLELYGGGAADVIPCAAGYALAAATGTLRIVGDKHYLTDVLVGAAVGTIAGLGLPWVLHYRFGEGERRTSRAARGGVDVRLVPTGVGAGLVGVF